MHEPSTPTLFRRTLLALALMAGFHVLIGVLLIGLVALPLIADRIGGRIHLELWLVALLAIGAILVGLFPPFPGDGDTGVALRREHHPRFFALLDDLARATAQPPLEEAYLVPATTAWVTHSGSRFLLGGRRVLAIGLPVLAALTEAELRAILAHEFAHFQGGETRLGGILHRTRAAMELTLESLARVGPPAAWLQLPLRAYGRFFMLRTMTVSRAQEWAADRVAARLAGRTACESALRKIHVLEEAFNAFLDEEVQPVLAERALPPIVEGFHRFLAAPRIEEQYARARAGIVEVSRSNMTKLPPEARGFDSHPWLHERVDALAGVGADEPPAAEAPAYFLLDDWPRLERAVVGRMVFDAPRFPRVEWESVGEEILVPLFRRRLAPVADLLRGGTIGQVGERLREQAFPIGLAFTDRSQDVAGSTDPAAIAARGVDCLACAVTITLAGRGWRVRSLPGEPLVAVGPGGEFAVPEALRALDLGRKEAGPWAQRCSELGIADWPIEITSP